MRTTKCGEIYISIDTHTAAEPAYKGKEMVGKESKVAERQRERERVCVCECWSTPMVASISIHKQRGKKKYIWHFIDGRHLWLISSIWWDATKMGFLTVSVITAQTFQATTIREKGVPLSQTTKQTKRRFKSWLVMWVVQYVALAKMSLGQKLERQIWSDIGSSNFTKMMKMVLGLFINLTLCQLTKSRPVFFIMNLTMRQEFK